MISIQVGYPLKLKGGLTVCRSGLVVSASDCSVRGPRFESHYGWLCLSRQPVGYRKVSNCLSIKHHYCKIYAMDTVSVTPYRTLADV